MSWSPDHKFGKEVCLQNIARDFEELDFEELQKTENDWKSFQQPSKDKEGSLTFKKN